MRPTPSRVASPPPPVTHRLPLRAAVWSTAFVVSGVVSIALFLPGTTLVLASPMSAVAVLWVATMTRRTAALDLSLLIGWCVTLSMLAGLGAWAAVAAPVSIVAHGLVFVAVMRRLAPSRRLFGGERTAWTMPDLAALLGAATVAGVVYALVITVGLGLSGSSHGVSLELMVRCGRTSATIVALGSVGLLVESAVHERRAGVRDRAGAGVASRIEVVALCAATLALYLLCFVFLDHLPLAWLTVVATVWAGIRLSVLGAALHGLVSAGSVLAVTLAGDGIFANLIPDAAERALVAQVYLLVISSLSLALAISRAELRRAELVVEERSRLLDEVIDTVEDGIALVGPDGTMDVVNPATLSLLGMSLRADRSVEVQARLTRADGTPHDSTTLLHARVLRGETVTGEELHVHHRDGTVRILEVNGHPLENTRSSGRRLAILTAHDVTADRLHQGALASFAGHVAHDLKNPLAVVQAWSELLVDAFQDGPVEAGEGQQMAARILGSATRMHDLIQGLLGYTLARDRPLNTEDVDLASVARDVAQVRAESLGDQDSPSILVDGSAIGLADPLLLRIVVDNLVANACKYVAPGVRPAVVVEVGDIDTTSVFVRVSDNGIGIPVGQRTAVFESFHRVEEGGEIEGSGLGLGICKRIVDRHRGTIQAEDVPFGASLLVTLPRASGHVVMDEWAEDVVAV